MEDRERNIQYAEKPGVSVEHNYGHGEQYLSGGFAMLMMLAFLVDQAQQCVCLIRAVWTKLGSKRMLWERSGVVYDYALTSMRQLFEALCMASRSPAPS